MLKQDPNKRYSYEFNKQGANEVSEQIMDAYNSGVIDQDIAQTSSEEFQSVDDFQSTEG